MAEMNTNQVPSNCWFGLAVCLVFRAGFPCAHKRPKTHTHTHQNKTLIVLSAGKKEEGKNTNKRQKQHKNDTQWPLCGGRKTKRTRYARKRGLRGWSFLWVRLKEPLHGHLGTAQLLAFRFHSGCPPRWHDGFSVCFPLRPPTKRQKPTNSHRFRSMFVCFVHGLAKTGLPLQTRLRMVSKKQLILQALYAQYKWCAPAAQNIVSHLL